MVVASTGKWGRAAGLLKDHSALSLLAANLFTIGVALYQRWDLLTLMWVYWGQSVIIGIVNFWRMWTLKKFSSEGLTSGGKPVPETVKGKRSMAIFFAIHYGGFHVVYLFFLLGGTAIMKDSSVARNAPFIALCIFGFLVNHVYSFLYNRDRDSSKIPNIGTIMVFPYARIIPMHLTIIFGFALASFMPLVSLLLFLVLKTGADLIMHAVEHGDFGAKAPVGMSLDSPSGEIEIRGERGGKQ